MNRTPILLCLTLSALLLLPMMGCHQEQEPQIGPTSPPATIPPPPPARPGKGGMLGAAPGGAGGSVNAGGAKPGGALRSQAH